MWHFQVKCHIMSSLSTSACNFKWLIGGYKFSTKVICCAALKYLESLFSSYLIIFLIFLRQSIFDHGCLSEFLTAGRPVAALFAAHCCSLHTNILPSTSSSAAKYSSPSAPFTDSTIYSGAPRPDQRVCVCVPVVGPIDRLRKCGSRERSSPCSRWCPIAGW